MKLTEQNAVEIFKRGGAVASTDWRYKGPIDNSRPVPKHCSKVSKHMIGVLHKSGRLHDAVAEAARSIMQSRPRVRRLIVIHDWPSVEALAVQSKLTAI